MHLGLDLLFERNFPAFENFLDVRPKLACLGIDDHEFFYETESKDVVFRTHGGGQCRSKIARCHGGSSSPLLDARIRPRSRICLASPAERSIHLGLHVISYASSPSARRVTAPCTNLPQLKLSRPGLCSRALRIAISDTASTTHSKFAWPTLAASASGAGLQKSMATGTPSRIANSTVFKSYPRY